MAETTAGNTIARQTVEQLTCRLAEPGWLTEARLSAWEAYLQAPHPSEKDELWRRTAIGHLDLTTLQTLQVEPAGVSKEMPKLSGPFAEAQQTMGELSGVVLQSTVGGGTQFLSQKAASRGVIFCDIATAIAEHGDKIRPYLAGVTNVSEDGKFTLLTSALFNCGMVLYVPAGVELSEPFLYGLDWSENTPGAQALLPLLLVVTEERSSVTVVTANFAKETAAKDKLSLLASHGRIHIKPSAHVRWLDVSDLHPGMFTVGRTTCLIERDGRLETMVVSLGCAQAKQDLSARLTAPGASSDMLGIILGDEKEKFSFNTIVDHDATDTTSNINFRVALKDESTSVYQGIVKVAKVAQRTNAYQSNKNLLLSGQAKADSIPKLEILADDVKCSHGATVGPVDRDQLFYLQSRGLSEAQAEELVVLGFFRQVLEASPFKSALNWLSHLVSEKIHEEEGGDGVEEFFTDFDFDQEDD